MTCSETDKVTTNTLVSDDRSASLTSRTQVETENKRKEMVHALVDTATEKFKYSDDTEDNPNSPRSNFGCDGNDKIKHLCKFQCFVDYCLVHTRPKKEWKMRRTTEKVSDVFTCADEAFAVLTLENNCNDWKMIIDGTVPGAGEGANKVGRTHSKSVYTTWGATKKDGKTKQNLQWTSKGIQRFNQLHRKIKLERELPETSELEESLRKSYELQQVNIMKEIEDESEYDRVISEYEQPVNEF